MTPDEQIASLAARVSDLEAFVAALKGALGGTAAGGVASDRELDGERGDPIIKYSARDWKGASFVGKRLSQTTPEYLEFAAEGNEDYARYLRGLGDPKKTKAAGYREVEARLARGWAKRLLAGWKAPDAPPAATNPWARPPSPSSQSAGESESDEEIPF